MFLNISNRSRKAIPTFPNLHPKAIQELHVRGALTLPGGKGHSCLSLRTSGGWEEFQQVLLNATQCVTLTLYSLTSHIFTQLPTLHQTWCKNTQARLILQLFISLKSLLCHVKHIKFVCFFPVSLICWFNFQTQPQIPKGLPCKALRQVKNSNACVPGEGLGGRTGREAKWIKP